MMQRFGAGALPRMVEVVMALALVLGGCSSDSGGGGGTGSDSSGGTDGTDGTDSGTCAPGDLGGECNPLCTGNTGCAEGQICTLNGSTPQCVAPGTQPLGKGCNEEATCAEGVCVSAESGGSKCRTFCKNAADCTAEENCGTLSGIAGVGACVPKPEGCSVFEQDCTEAGQACYVAGCLEAGTVTLGEPCDQNARCVKGLVCADGGTGTNTCNAPCNPNTGGPSPKCHLTCPGNFATLIDENGDSLGVGICQGDDGQDDCNLLTQDCPAGQGCYWTGNGPRCRDEGASAIGTSCDAEDACEKGAICWPIGTKCRAVCNPSETLHNECNDSTTKCPALTSNAGYCDE